MKATIDVLEDNKVKLSVEVDEDEFDSAVDRAFRRIAREVRIPGFRPGKAPRKLLEARLGAEVGREEALREELPAYYAQAVTDHEIDAIAAPEIEVNDGQEAGPVRFDAVVEVRPEVTVEGYDSLDVTIEGFAVDEAAIDEQIDQLRQPFAELEPVERPAIDGDNLTIDVTGSQNGEEQEGLTTEDYLYELGSGSFLPEFDDHLGGVKAGDIIEFEADHPDPEEDGLTFRVLVKEVKEKVLPDIDDEWASDASEFETVDELRADLENRMTAARRVQGQMMLRQATIEAVSELVEIEIPEAMIGAELEQRVQDLTMRLQAQGMSIQDYMAASGQDQESLLSELREVAAGAARADLALRAVAAAEGVEVSDEDVSAEFDALSARLGRDVDEIRATIEDGDSMAALRSDLRKQKALDWLVDNVNVIDDEGNPIDRHLLEPDPEDTESEATESEATESEATDLEAATDQEPSE